MKPIHVQLSDKRGEILMFEVLREDLADELGLALDKKRSAIR